jgi:hypothetical protein
MVADIAQIGRADAAGKIGGWHRLPPYAGAPIVSRKLAVVFQLPGKGGT